MQHTRKDTVLFPAGEVHARIDVHGDLFGTDAIGPVLDELLSWTKMSISDKLIPQLAQAEEMLDLPLRETVVESYARLNLDGNSFDISVEVTVPYRVSQNGLKSIIIDAVTGDALAQFTDMVREKLAEGSLPEADRFRTLMPA